MRSLLEIQRDFLTCAREPADGAGGGMAIYRNNWRANCIGALTAAHPVIARLVGEGFFAWMTACYVDANPSNSANLEDYGGSFADFIATFEAAASLPYLADVARLERAVDRAFSAFDDDIPAVCAEQLLSLAGGTIRFDSSASLFESRWPAARIWQANLPDAAQDMAVSLDDPGTRVLIRREGFSVELDPIDIGEGVFLGAIALGHAPSEAMFLARTADHEFDPQPVIRERCGQQLFRLPPDCRASQEFSTWQ